MLNLVIFFLNFVDILQINSSSGLLKLCKRMFLLDHAFTQTHLKVLYGSGLIVFLYNFNIFVQARNQIIGLLIDRCDDPDKRTRKFACFAVRSDPIFYDIFFTPNTVAVEYNILLLILL
jgi:hypothetical protein